MNKKSVLDITNNKNPLLKNIKLTKNISPVKSVLDTRTITPMNFNTKLEEEKPWYQTFFKGAESFEDGKWDAGDLTKTILNSAGDLGLNIVEGFAQVPEQIGTAIAGAEAQVADWLGFDEHADNVRKRIANNGGALISGLAQKGQEALDKDSVFDKTSDNVASGIGQMLSYYVGSKVPVAGSNIKVGKLNVPTTALLSGTGGGLQEAYQNENVEDWQAWSKALGSGTIEGISEGIFGVLGVGGSELDDYLVKSLTKNIKNTIAKSAIKLGIKSSGEAAEEFISYAGNYLLDRVIDKTTELTGKENVKFSKDWDWDEVGEQMASAFLSTLITQGAGDLAANKLNKNNTESNSIFSKQEINNALEKYTNSQNAETSPIYGKKQTNPLSTIFNEKIVQANQNNTIDFDENKKYHISSNFSNEIDNVLNNNVSSNTQVKARDYTPKILVNSGVKDLPMLITQKHIKSTIYTPEEAKKIGLPTKNVNYHGLGKEMLIKAIDGLDNPDSIYKINDEDYLVITQFKDNNNREIVVPIRIDGKGRYNDVFIDENQIKSVYGRNNLSNYIKNNNFELIYKKGTSDFNERIQYSNVADVPINNSITQKNNYVKQENPLLTAFKSKIAKNDYYNSANKYNIDVTNDTVKEMFRVANERGIDIRYDSSVFTNSNQNAYWNVKKDGKREIVLNPNADTGKALQSIIIHEMLHDMEGTKQYNNLAKLVLEYAKEKGEYKTALRSISNIYSNYYNINSKDYMQKIEKEMVADILGEKFGSQEFLNTLVKKNRTLMQKVHDWIIDLLNKINKLTGYHSTKLYWSDVESKLRKAFNQEYVGEKNKNRLSVTKSYNMELEEVEKDNKKLSISINENNSIKDNKGRILTKEQQEYFKDSKVRDEKGNLKTMYHGSNNKFSIFKHGKAYRGSSKASVGYWFTETAEGAKRFADSVWYGDTKTGPKVYEVYLDIKNPKIYERIDNTNELNEIDYKINSIKETLRKLENKNIAIEINEQELRWANSKEELMDIAKYEGIDFEDAENYHNAIKQYDELIEEYDNKKYNDSYELFRSDIYKIAGKNANEANSGGTGMYLSNEEEVVKQYVEDLKQQGYDGIIIKNTKFDNETLGKDNSQYVVFNSNQIKNVNNLNPTNSEDIRYSSQNNNEWQNFLKQNFNNNGTKTTMQDIKLPKNYYPGLNNTSVEKNIINSFKNEYKPKEIKSAIKKDFEIQGYVNLNNTKINNSKELAEIAQIFRNPYYEITRILYMNNDGVLLGYDSFSAHKPNETYALKDTNQESIDATINKMKVLKADYIVHLHNHPSGDPKPSQQDLIAINGLNQYGIPAKGMVIDHNKYSYIEDGKIIFDTIKDTNDEDFILENIGKISSVEELAKISANTQHKHKNIIIFTDVKNNIRSIQEATDKFLKDDNKVIKYINEQLKNNGAVKVFTSSKNSLIKPVLEKYVRAGILQDSFFDDTNTSLMQNNNIAKENEENSKKNKNAKVEREIFEDFSTIKKKENSIKTTKNGIKYVQVDSNFFENIPDADRPRYLMNYIKENLAGKVIKTDDGTDIHILDKEDNRLGKLVHGNITYDKRIGNQIENKINRNKFRFEITGNVLNNLENMIKISKVTKHKSDIENRHGEFAEKGFDTRSSYIYDGKNVYRVNFDIAINSKSKNNLYAIKSIQKRNSIVANATQGMVAPLKNEVSYNPQSFNTNSIPQNKNNVNDLHNLEEDTKKYSVSEEHSDSYNEQIKTIDKVLMQVPKEVKTEALNLKEKLYTELFDDLYIIDKISKETGVKGLYYIANNARQSRATADYIIGQNMTDLLGNNKGKSFKQVWEQIPKEDRQAFSDYLFNKHNEQRYARNKGVFGDKITAEQSLKIAQEYESKHPEFKEYAKDVYEYLDGLRNILVQGGLISKKQAKMLKEMYPYYVPTYRSKISTGAVSNFQNNISVKNQIKKATGSENDILPLQTIIPQLTVKYVNAARRNTLYNTIYKLVKKYPDVMSKYAVEVKEKGKNKKNIDVDVVNENLDNTLKSSKENNDDGNILTLYQNGEKVKLKISNELYKALTSFDNNTYFTKDSTFIKIVNKLSNLKKSLITTYNPIFSLTNFAKDFQDAIVYSNDAKKFAKKFPQAIKKMATNSKEWQMYQALGATQSGIFDREKGYKGDSKLPKKAIEKIADMNEFVEQIPRFSEFLSYIEKNGTDYNSLMEAMYRASDITVNFARSGRISRTLDKLGAIYFNAAMQGADRAIRSVVNNPQGNGDSRSDYIKGAIKTITKASLIAMVPALFNYLIYKDDEDYKELSDYQKDNYYLIKVGNKFLRIPKGRFWGGAFAATGVRTARAIDGEKDAFKGLGKQISDVVAPQNPLTNNLYSPIIDIANNKSWAGSEIVPKRLQNLEPKDQYDESTTSIAKWLGDKLNISPKQIDYVLQQNSGIIGQILIPPLTPKAENNAISSKFIVDPVMSNKLATDFYDLKDELTKKKNSEALRNDLPEGFDTETSLLVNYLNREYSKITELNKEKRQVQSSNLKKSEKEKEVREVQKQINDIYRRAVDNVNNNKGDLYIEYINSNDTGKVKKESMRLFEKYGDKDILPVPSEYKSISVYGVKIDLTDDEKEQYNKIMLNALNKLYSKIFSLNKYNSLSDENKIKLLDTYKGKLATMVKEQMKPVIIKRITKDKETLSKIKEAYIEKKIGTK